MNHIPYMKTAYPLVAFALLTLVTPLEANSNTKAKTPRPQIIEIQYGFNLEKREVTGSTSQLGGAAPYEILKLYRVAGRSRVLAALRDLVGEDDVCVAIGNTPTVIEEMPTGEESALERKFLSNNRIAPSYSKPVNKLYSVTFERPDGTRYRISSDIPNFFNELILVAKPTERLAEARKIAELKAAQSAEEANRAAEQERNEFQNYLILPDEIKDHLLADLKARKEKGELIVKNMAVGLPLSYFLANDELSFKLYKSGSNMFDLVMGIEKDAAPGEKPDGLAIKVGEQTIAKIPFDDLPITKVESEYYLGNKPIKEITIHKINLDKAALDELFNSSKLTAEEFIKGFCKHYDIDMPAIWTPESEIVRDIASGGSDLQNTYKLRDKRGVNLTFVSFNKKPFYSLTLESAPSDKDLSASFD